MPGGPLPSLLGRWTFNESNFLFPQDSSGFGNTGTSIAGNNINAPASPAVLMPSPGGSAIVLAGNRSVRVADSNTIDQTGINSAFTVAAWVRSDVASQTATIVSRAMAGTNSAQFELGLDNGRPVAKVHFFGGPSPSVLPVDGQFHKLVATYDGISTRIYLDGMLIGGEDIGWPVAADETPLMIGARQVTDGTSSSLSGHFNGAIDEVRLYNAAISDASVTLTP